MGQLDHADLRTETFSNSRGWTAVRVTHTPSSTTVERSRGGAVQSAVQAQRECIDELARILAGGAPSGGEGAGAGEGTGAGDRPQAEDQLVSRSELEALEARVADLERHIGRRR